MLTSQYRLLVRAAAGDQEAVEAAAAVLIRGLEAYFRAGERIPLERCVGLPSSPRAYHIARRDYWLCEAHDQLSAPTPWKRSVALAEELARFRCVLWPAWRDLETPPPGSSMLRTCLFNAMKAAACASSLDGSTPMPDTARQLHNIVKRIDGEISQP